MALSVQTKRELLPFDMQSQAGFLFPTVIKPSSFEGAGLGRYVKAAIKKGWVVRADPIVSVDDFIENGGVNPNYTLAINLADKGDIDALEKFWMTNDDETSEVKDLPVPVLMSWYIANVAAERTDTNVETGLGYILGHSFITNQCSDNNLQTYVDNGMLYHKAVRDIRPGEELFLNYSEMKIPGYMQEWCAERNLTDVGTLSETIEAAKVNSE